MLAVLCPVAYLGFCEGGGQNQRCEVRGAGGANGVECGDRGVPSPLKKGSGEGAVPPPQKFFFGSMCSKKFCVQAKGGGASPSAPPKYATAYCPHSIIRSRVYATVGRQSTHLSKSRRTPLLRVWCCGTCGQEGDIDGWLHGSDLQKLRQGKCSEYHVVS